MGETDEDGFIYLVDRKKDVIITGGENLYPVEIENFIRRHDAVKDVLARKIDVLAFDRPALMTFAKESGGKLAVSPLETREHYGIAVSKERPDCLEAVNAVIRERQAK